MKKLHFIFGVFALMIFSFSQVMANVSADDVVGVWWNEEKEAKIEIYKCGDEYCGKIIWLKEPNREDGSVKLDRENPEPKLRSRKVMGLQILKGFEYEGDGEYEDGEIYDPKKGKTYDCIMTLSDNGNTLDVRGYIGFSLIGRTTTWTRAE
ncbi:DUF2147 domain-containing protein [Roseivirga sp. BDSF3-8]|uniref:DUF2147 domain-containing protein n=1 Tax=Roseivirga sp. BDSF3-8 TaxID=3241598 RepID=UPI0035319ECA